MNTESEQQKPQQEVLYKYRDWTDEYSKRSVKDLEVFFPSPRQFNDPFDCAIPPDPFTATEDDIRARAARLVARDMPDANRIDQLYETDVLLKRFERNSKNPEFRENWERDTKQAMDDNFGVLSLTTDRTSILMWSYYANKHEGFCVGYDVRVLLDAVKPVAHEAYALSRVKYQRDFPDLRLEGYVNTIDLVMALLTTKAKDWEHEQEYRLTLEGRNEMPISLPKCAIVEVIVGARMPSDHVEEIESLLEGHGLLSTLRRAELAKDEYAITIEEIRSE